MPETDKIIHEILPVGMLQCNCHIIGDPKTGEALVIDPGDDAEAHGVAVVGLVAGEVGEQRRPRGECPDPADHRRRPFDQVARTDPPSQDERQAVRSEPHISTRVRGGPSCGIAAGVRAFRESFTRAGGIRGRRWNGKHTRRRRRAERAIPPCSDGVDDDDEMVAPVRFDPRCP